MNDIPPKLFDLAVIGGGVNGCGIARDAAGRGAKVLLLEGGDLASGTSSASTKLIHGGLRYLEHYEFGLVRESLSERERLWAIAPHIAWPMRFVLPHVRGLRPRWLVRLGLLLYDNIGGRKLLPATSNVALAMHPAGAALKPEFHKAFIYSDCWVDDARLVVLNARDAADRGAEVRTRCRVTALTREGDYWTIAAGGDTFHARALVNAAGPAVLELLDLAGVRSHRAIRLVRGSHIVVRRLFDHKFAYFFQLPDKRIFFAIPYERDFTLIGTTDVDHQGGLDNVEASAEEIAYLCDGASRFFLCPVTTEDVVWTYSGVRPLIDDGSGRPEAATRGYSLDLSDKGDGAPLLSVFGGKLTTYRHLAQEAMGRLASRLEVLRGPDWTGKEPLPGGDFPVGTIDEELTRLQSDYSFLAPAWADRLIHAYGTRAWDFLGDARTLDECGIHFGHGLTQREVDFLVAEEWAVTKEDILWRRSKLGLYFTREEGLQLSGYLQEKAFA